MGKILIDQERCKGCQFCLDTCPKKLIHISEEFNEKGYHFALFKESEECSACTMCGRICPDMAIEVYK
ncbi:MAG: ferredoxin family protein [Deltaproteobacteria bacterium]|nr:ferredoxin family protein [Deltaproteobacteria bacterium]